MAMTRRESAAAKDRRLLIVVFGLSAGVMVLELAGSYAANSLALLADAVHVMTDLGGIGLALGAIWIAGRPATNGRTFGLYRWEILAAAVNAVVLFGLSAFILWQAWQRLSQPPEVQSGLMLAVAVVGLAANAVSFYMLREAQARSLNLRAAYLEVMGDLAGAGSVIVAAAVIALTGFQAADALASALIGLLILPRTWLLLRQAVDILLEATPQGVNLDEVRSHIRSAPGVRDVHDLHVWTITSGLNVVSAHVVIAPDAGSSDVLDNLCRCLWGDFDIEHSTFQLEREDRRALEEHAHA
jgi:cobalt-zinc-cadmium efflux system protein